MDYDVLVIGGGASGMMAAGRAAERGLRVLLIEKNTHLGRKLSITGGGRCNITNGEPDEHRLLDHYGDAKPFLYSSFAQFGVRDTYSFFEQRGLPLREQAHRRVFPESENAEDVVRVLEQYLEAHHVDIWCGRAVEHIHIIDGVITAVSAGGKRVTATSYVLATGGFSHPETGSTGDGFSWLSMLGHRVHAPTPTLAPLVVDDAWVHAMAGTTLRDARITFFLNGEKKSSVRGDILCTHVGMSGPLILNQAGMVSDLLHEGAVTAQIDAYPAEDIGALDSRIVSVFDANKNKLLKNVWNEIAPLGSGAALPALLTGLSPEEKVHSITKEQRRSIVDLLKALPVTIQGLMGYEKAVIADGGVLLDEIDMRTMQSKKIRNLYVTGDLLHIRRPSGGYSLQLCWTTGFVAGNHVGNIDK